MKSIFFSLLASILLCNPLFSQNTPLAVAYPPEAPVTETTPAALRQTHSHLATRQISEHLAENVFYPETMTDYAFDGTVTLRVSIDKKGKVSGIVLKNTDLPSEFTKTGISIMRKLKRLQIKGRTYRGQQTFNVPIHFSL